MHEMSIAMNILDIVERTAQTNGASAVKDIFLEVGVLAGVMVSALEFNLDIAKRSTRAQDANIHILEIEGRGHCPACGGTFPMGFHIEPCPECEGGYLSMTSGDELRVKEIEVEKEA